MATMRAVLLSLLLCACTRPAPEPLVLAPAATVDEQLARYCRVCFVDHPSAHEEYLPSRLDLEHDGRTYRFCKDDCRARFEAERERYLVSD